MTTMFDVGMPSVLRFLDPAVDRQLAHSRLGHDLFCGVTDPFPFRFSNDWTRLIWTSNVTSIVVKALDTLKNMKDEELLDTVGMADLKVLKALGIITAERFDAIAKLSAEKLPKENDSLPFSELLKKKSLEELLEIYTPEALKEKFKAEFAHQDLNIIRNRNLIMHKVGFPLFFTPAGRELVDYSQFANLGTVKLHEVLELEGEEITFTFEPNKVVYEFRSTGGDSTRYISKTTSWS